MITTGIIFISVLIGTSTAILSDPPNSKKILPEYDFIIVGSGPAGCALANRLSEVPIWNVLLLEAGRKGGIRNDIPKKADNALFTHYNWQYKMEYTPNVCLGSTDQRCVWPAGRALGGTSLISHMLYTRGNRLDYDHWAEAGNPGWSYDEVLPYFKKSETSTVKMQEPDYHNRSGPWYNEDVKFQPEISKTFLDAGKELGFPVMDYNGVSQIGFSYVQANTKNGVRQSGYNAFIEPVETRPNLHVVTRARVTKVLINNTTKTAYGVIFLNNRQYHQVFASKEVILSAGSIKSPQLLMLSGVGPKAHLASVGIDVVQDVPGVGQNLKDHLAFVGMVFTTNTSVTGSNYLPDDPVDYLQLILTRTGPLTSPQIEAIAFINTYLTINYPTVPDVEIFFTHGEMTRNLNKIAKISGGWSQEPDQATMKALAGKNFCYFLPVLLNPQSVGHLELQSKNPYIPPRLYGNYLSDPNNMDVRTLIRAIKFAEIIANTTAFRQYGLKRHVIVLPACKNLVVNSNAYWECIIRHFAISAYHQIGTCKMGPDSDKMAVVNNFGQVRGIDRLRVADCSIIPMPLAGHAAAPSFMIGEKISDAIKLRWSSG